MDEDEVIQRQVTRRARAKVKKKEKKSKKNMTLTKEGSQEIRKIQRTPRDLSMSS